MTEQLKQLILLVVSVVVFFVALLPATITLGSALNAPKSPTGWSNINYDAARVSRAPLTDLLAAAKQDPTKTPMINYKTATANFGGIFTENMNPWAGTVDPEAARLQVYAGARAVIFDVWPDPAHPANAIVCAMTDVTQTTVQRWWYNNGLSRGVGRYSNWQMLTRNSQPAQTMIDAAVTAAFDSSNKQASDPFFLILKLHGAMNLAYLNRLGAQVGAALHGRGMAVQASNQYNANEYCNVPVSEFLNKVFVMVIPDIQQGYYSLPGVKSYDKFQTAFKGTTLAQYTNSLETQVNTVFFDPNSSLSALKAESVPGCGGGTSLVAPPTVGFTVLQPTVGGTTTTNTGLIPNSSWTDLMESGAHFIAVNLFSPSSSDAYLESFFESQWFGKYSFVGSSA